MKKWWLHTVSCICNGIAATTILLLFFYEFFKDNSQFTFGDGLGVFVILLGYSIYISSDIWGLKLYSRYKNLDSVSYTDTGKIHVLLVFLTLVQIFVGYAAFAILRRLTADFASAGKSISDYWDILAYMILIVFFTSVIVFIGFILLLRAIKKNRTFIKQEIDYIGKTDRNE